MPGPGQVGTPAPPLPGRSLEPRPIRALLFVAQVTSAESASLAISPHFVAGKFDRARKNGLRVRVLVRTAGDIGRGVLNRANAFVLQV